MESSEDDAGAATNASRRVSAREKDVGQIEDVNATSSFYQDPSEPRTSCETPAMSEDNFDGDSVPSPSTQDVNTSTEAILDMIDEIVDGPGAPKRLPFALENDTDSRFAGGGETNITVGDIIRDESTLMSEHSAPAASAKIEDEECLQSNSSNVTFKSEVLVDVKVDCVELPRTSSSVPTSNVLAVIKDTQKDAVSCSEEPQGSSVQIIPSSSVVQTVQSVLETESSPCERTVKIVTSSDKRDNVIVESAESTSSDNSISERRAPIVESVTRSPLRRRLVRPLPIRPDSTVSSTVDSSINIHTSEQASECIIKDVSSSSDAVTTVQGSIKSEEIKNVSEVSICKAETSGSPVKKIKLIRQKTTPQTSSTLIEQKVDTETIQTQIDQCQSTSSDISIITAEPSINSAGEVQTINNAELEIQSDPKPENISTKPSQKDIEVLPESFEVSPHSEELPLCTSQSNISPEKDSIEEHKKLSPLKITIPTTSTSESTELIHQNTETENIIKTDVTENSEETESTKQVPKLTIKLGNKHTEELKSPVPKLTIKPIRPPSDIKTNLDIKEIPHVTKLNIKPITKQPERINEIHRKSSSSEISESEYSENDESTSTSDQASASDQGSSEIVPKVTIKLGKPGTESEGQFYTEKNIPKLTIKTIQNCEIQEQSSPTKMKVILSQSEDTPIDKVPKLTIKTVAKSDGQPVSPKLIIKPIKPPDEIVKQSAGENIQTADIPKLKISPETLSNSPEVKDAVHVPKITIKPISKSESEISNKSKKLSSFENAEHIPVVTKLNIKPVLKPSESIELSEGLDDKVPVVSKLNIKPVVKPKDSEIDCSRDDVPKITKLNIKPLKSPETNSSEQDCDVLKTDLDENSIPVITKLNIKPIIKPLDEDSLKDNENQSSETSNSSDDNADQIPVVTKINIKPICKPNDMEESGTNLKKEENIPIITKLNIKPLIKPDESISPSSPKREISKITSTTAPIMKLNIKPVLKPEEIKEKEMSMNEIEEAPTKNPPLVMKINRKSAVNETEYSIDKNNDHEHCNNVTDESIPIIPKISIKPIIKTPNEESLEPVNIDIKEPDFNCKAISSKSNELELVEQNINKNPLEISQNCVTGLNKQEEKLAFPERDPTQLNDSIEIIESGTSPPETKTQIVDCPTQNITAHSEETIVNSIDDNASDIITNLQSASISTLKTSDERVKTRSIPVRQNCTLLKKLLETRKERSQESEIANKSNALNNPPKSPAKNLKTKNEFMDKINIETKNDAIVSSHINENRTTDLICSVPPLKVRTMQELCSEANENMTKPLEISISDKISHANPDQDSPRIILKINKTDQGASAKIITEETKKSDLQCYSPENTHEIINDVQKKNFINSRRKPHIDTPMPMGKRLRSSRILQPSEKSPLAKRNIGKRPSTTETTPVQGKEAELSVLETKRLKLGQLLSNKSLTITPIKAKSQVSPPVKPVEIIQGGRNHSLLNNENCAKNGSSKLHNILTNLQAKQLQVMPFSDLNHTENNQSLSPDLKSSTSTCSPELISDSRSIEKVRPEVQMIFNDNSESRDFSIEPEELARDPLEMDNLKPNDFLHDIPKPVEMTPQPKKRGRPRKLPVSEGAKTVISLPATALEERPQRSLRLSRDRPVILVKPRGRGRGRGRRLESESNPTTAEEAVVDTANKFFMEQKPEEEIDPTSSRIKLPRMTEALDKMPSVCSTPLSSRRRSSSSELQLFDSTPDLNVLETTLSKMEDPFLKSPEIISEGRGRGGRGGRGSRGGRGRAAARSPRGRGRGRGGGRGAMYMKETMGIYGRVCGPATTTVQLFEEETCMMDDNATPAKPSHLLDEDSQSSVKSSTNDSNKMKKSKFADLFDSNKVWTAADVKEYTWPAPEKLDGEPQVMMIQEQVAMFLNVKSFKRRYPELKRRAITGEERDYVLSKGLVTEALCDLGITAVDASEVLDIMLSDYPHKYEEFRCHQREKQLAEPMEEAIEEPKPEMKLEKMDVKEHKAVEQKPEPPKVDPEKTRQDMAAAAIASASEWNARMNALRRPACADLQSLTVQRRRAPPPPPRLRVAPPHGFYPHALLPGQYQHTYRVYAPQDLRYFPLNTALAAPPAPPSPVESSSESDAEWGSRCSSSDSGQDVMHSAKRKKLTKTKRSSQTETATVKEEEADTCRVCKLRIEANRKYTHERFLVCAHCNAKLHPSCVELGADTIRKCREYAWQCAECKTCCACRRPADDDKMLFCDLCDRGFHIYCVGLQAVPNGRWHCVECAVCKSCGARSPGGAAGAAGAGGAGADWHHQTRRGPGGHKLYSHSLCTPCARAYRIGRYCPLCDRSFIGPKGTMQLVICKLCDRQLHQECVRQTVSALNVLDYTCGECRRGGITSRAAAVRLAPRTIATLFMAKRRFNKYAHRQYLQSRLRPDDAVS